MPFEPSMTWVIVLNVFGWPIIQFGWAFALTAMPARWFGNPAFFVWESKRGFYRSCLAVHLWKRWLPDAADLFGIGSSKSKLLQSRPEHLTSFIQEARRGEVCHWCALLSASIFFLWNPLWADAIMLAIGVALNLPCIVSLRYARLRLTRIGRVDTARKTGPTNAVG